MMGSKVAQWILDGLSANPAIFLELHLHLLLQRVLVPCNPKLAMVFTSYLQNRNFSGKKQALRFSRVIKAGWLACRLRGMCDPFSHEPVSEPCLYRYMLSSICAHLCGCQVTCNVEKTGVKACRISQLIITLSNWSNPLILLTQIGDK